jgi:hypothetical protein
MLEYDYECLPEYDISQWCTPNSRNETGHGEPDL